MALIDIFKKRKKPEVSTEVDKPKPEAYSSGGIAYSGGLQWANQVFAIPFDGEKDTGEMGPIRRYVIDHTRLRYRSWQSYIESDVCQALFERSAMWGIGGGLKLQSEPQTNQLSKEGVTVDAESFNDEVEEMFKLYASSTMCDYSEKRSLHEIMKEAWINADIGGDVLIVLRLVNGAPKVQLIDGANLATPLGFGSNNGIDVTNPDTGNVIRYGVEMDARGRQVAYWVRKTGTIIDQYSFERIAARMNKYPYSEMARLVYGRKYRLENVRGIPLITAVMETASKMGRYREATLGSAEERAKIVYSINHERFSTGENPTVAQMTQAAGFGLQTDLPTDSLGNELANKITATTNKQTYNMPIGSELKALDSKQEINFKDFYLTNFDIVCAVAGYPPEVIMSKYDSNYSASRAAIKDFEHTLEVKRGYFSSQAYQLVYNFCLDIWALQGKINAPGYLQLIAERNEMGATAYRFARWNGDVVPHIDPYKEIQAFRAMLPEDSKNFPLATFEQVVEMMGGGDYKALLDQYQKERDLGKEKGIEMVLSKGESKEDGSETQTTPARNGNPKPKGS